MTTDELKYAADHWGGINLDAVECREVVNKIDALTAAVQRAIEVLDDPYCKGRHRTARELRELLDRQSSGDPGQLTDGVTDRHDVHWGPCPKCGCCTDLAFPGWPHGPSKPVKCANCGWSGVFVDNRESELQPPHESG